MTLIFSSALLAQTGTRRQRVIGTRAPRPCTKSESDPTKMAADNRRAAVRPPERRRAKTSIADPLKTAHRHLPPSHRRPRDRSRRPLDSVASVASLPDLPKPAPLRAPLAPPISSRETAWRSTQSKRCRETLAPRKTPLENSRPESDREPPESVSSKPIRLTAPDNARKRRPKSRPGIPYYPAIPLT
jgi:hypothetical protein